MAICEKTALHANGALIKAFFHWCQKDYSFQKIFESLYKVIQGPAISHEDKNAAIPQIQARQLTSRFKHLDSIHMKKSLSSIVIQI